MQETFTVRYPSGEVVKVNMPLNPLSIVGGAYDNVRGFGSDHYKVAEAVKRHNENARMEK